MKNLLAIFGAALAITAADFTVGWNHPETERYIIEGRNPTNTVQPGGAAERFIVRMQHNDFPTVDVPLTNIIGLFDESIVTNRYGHVRTNLFVHSFTNLPPGQWTFAIKVNGLSGLSSEFREPLIISTNPPAAPTFEQIIVRLP